MPSDIPRPPRPGQDPPARHLRIVRPSPSKPLKKWKQKPPPVFTPDEEARLRASLRTASALFGTGRCLADVLRIDPKALSSACTGRKRVTAALAVRLSKALGVPLESLYRPGLRVVPFPSICPSCGRGPA
jgi:hypothetical protein